MCKIRSVTSDKKTLAVEDTLTENYKSKYVIRLDHEILTDHSACG